MTILLVEDNEDDAFFLKRALRKSGIPTPIQRVCDGREALDYLQGSNRFGDRIQFPLPGLVLLDLKLPYMMGLDVLKWIRGQAQFRSITVLMLSASQYPEDLANAHRDGADAYLVKPSTLDQLDIVASTIRDEWLTAPRDPPLRTCRSDGRGET